MPLEFYFLLAGIVLLAIEMIVPGFGIFGICGIISFTYGSYYLMGGGAYALSIIAGIYIFMCIIMLFLFLYLPRDSKWNPFVLWDKQKNSDGYTGNKDLTIFLHKKGVTLTALRPAGTAIIDETRFDVSSLGDYIPKNTPIRIIKIEGNKIFVEKIRE